MTAEPILPIYSARLYTAAYCRDCGWPVILMCDGEAWLGYCSNKGCAHHAGEPWLRDPAFVARYPECERCQGTGQTPNQDGTMVYNCRQCNGNGWITPPIPMPLVKRWPDRGRIMRQEMTTPGVMTDPVVETGDA